MTKKWIAINLLLLATAGLLGWYVRGLMFGYNPSNKDKPKAGDTISVQVMPKPDDPRIYNAHEFDIVPEKFLFSENRNNIPEPPPPPPPTTQPDPVPQLTQKPILVATLISDRPLALIIDPSAGATIPRGTPAGPEGAPPGPPPQTSRRAQVKRIGDTYQGYTITSITSESIVLKAGTRMETIPLHEGSKGKKGSGKTAIAATRVVNIGGTSGGTSGTTGGTSSRGTSAGSTTPGAAGSGGPPTSGGRGGTATPIPTTPATPAAAPAPPSVRPINVVGEAPAGGVIRTPFGDITRQ